MTRADDARFTSGLFGMSDAARYLGVPRQTFHRWAMGDAGGKPLLHVVEPARDRDARVTFIALAEAWVLYALREAGVVTRRIRPALAKLTEEFGIEYVLVSPELATDGIDVLWDFSRTDPAGDGLIAAHTGQRVLREIVADHLRYVSRDSDGLPDRLTLRRCEPSKVVVDPARMFGQPVFEGSRIRLADVAAMLKAGEDPAVVADEFAIGADDVRTAARVLLGRAA